MHIEAVTGNGAECGYLEKEKGSGAKALTDTGVVTGKNDVFGYLTVESTGADKINEM